MNRIREALGDSASNPRFVETLAREDTDSSRRSNAFQRRAKHLWTQSAPVPAEGASTNAPSDAPLPETRFADAFSRHPMSCPTRHIRWCNRSLSSSTDVSGFYVGALANLGEIEDLLSQLTKSAHVFTILVVTAAILIPVRAFILSATLFHAPGGREKLLKIWPVLLLFDELWALSPFLLLHHINFGLALACTTLLVYSPFAQRSLVLMGAGNRR